MQWKLWLISRSHCGRTATGGYAGKICDIQGIVEKVLRDVELVFTLGQSFGFVFLRTVWRMFVEKNGLESGQNQKSTWYVQSGNVVESESLTRNALASYT